MRNTWVVIGKRSCLITDSAETKTVVESIKQLETKPQRMSPEVRKGRKSFIGVLNRPPNIPPMQVIMTAVEIVIQKGPREERLYF